MALFGLFKKEKKIESPLVRFLDEFDEKYQLMYKSQNVNIIAEFVSREVFLELQDKVCSGEEVYFGVDRYRTLSYVVESRDGDRVTVRKHVNHDNVKLSHGFELPLGSEPDYLILVEESGKFLIVEFKEVEDV